MVSAQDIRDVRFSKSFGGYKTSEVDTFLDDCAATVDSLVASNEENNRKMQVLAESIVEYRNREDSIRTALLSAQRMSESVIDEAKEKAAEIIAQAEKDAAAVLENARRDIAAEMEELQRLKNEVAAFKARLLATYREHLTLIGVLEEENDAEETATQQEEPPVTADAPQEATNDQTDTTQPEESAVKLDLSAYELKEDE